MGTKILIFVWLLMLGAHASACALPRAGAEIKVTGPHEDGYYKAVIPRTLAGYKQEPTIQVQFAENPDGNEALQPSYSIGAEKILISIPATELEDRPAYVRAFWPPDSPGMCGVIATSPTFGG